MEMVAEFQLLPLRYVPWRNFEDPNKKEINEASFERWYNKMMEVFKATQRIPKSLLDDYS